jgi:hypothetical protein
MDNDIFVHTLPKQHDYQFGYGSWLHNEKFSGEPIAMYMA